MMKFHLNVFGRIFFFLTNIPVDSLASPILGSQVRPALSILGRYLAGHCGPYALEIILTK